MHAPTEAPKQYHSATYSVSYMNPRNTHSKPQDSCHEDHVSDRICPEKKNRENKIKEAPTGVYQPDVSYELPRHVKGLTSSTQTMTHGITSSGKYSTSITIVDQ